MRREMTQEMTREMSRVIGRVMPQAFLLCLTVLLTSLVFAQGPVNPHLLAARWPAQWIAAPATPPFDYGVYHFRKTLELPAAPSRFLVHVSADNRYRLFVNGRFVAAGPPPTGFPGAPKPIPGSRFRRQPLPALRQRPLRCRRAAAK